MAPSRRLAPQRSVRDSCGRVALRQVSFAHPLLIGGPDEFPIPRDAFDLVAAALAAQVASAFGIGDIDDVRLHRGGFNDTCSVTTRKGGTYFLRAYRHSWRTCDDAYYDGPIERLRAPETDYGIHT